MSYMHKGAHAPATILQQASIQTCCRCQPTKHHDVMPGCYDSHVAARLKCAQLPLFILYTHYYSHYYSHYYEKSTAFISLEHWHWAQTLACLHSSACLHAWQHSVAHHGSTAATSAAAAVAFTAMVSVAFVTSTKSGAAAAAVFCCHWVLLCC